MSETNQFPVAVPDLSGLEQVDVVEVLVNVGDYVSTDQALLTLESDKASLDIPSPVAGKITEIAVALGDKVAEGQVIATIETQIADTTEEHSSPLVPSTEARASGAEVGDESQTGNTTAVAGDRQHLQTEVVVLGGGPGGYTAAFRAADLGKKVVLVERYPRLGGVCLNVGCIPSKALLHLAKLIDDAESAHQHGLRFGEPSVDLQQVNAWKRSVVDGLTDGLEGLARRRKVQVVTGSGRFRSDRELVVSSPENAGSVETIIEFEHAVIAAGSRIVRLPGVPLEDPRILDSTSALELTTVPKRLLVVGGGIIGLEMATVYRSFGSEITVVELLDSLIPGCDQDLVKPLYRHLTRRYQSILLGTKLTSVEPREDGLLVSFEGPSSPPDQIFDAILVAVGRQANGDRIGADEAGLKVDPRGQIEVDDQQRTHVSRIFAIGDITGAPMLAHKAIYEGKIAAEVIAGEKSGFEARVIPSVAYTDPEVAWVGVTEEQARKQGLEIGVGVFPWAASGRAKSMGRTEGRTKIIFEKKSARVLGGGVVGPHAGELIAEITLAIEMGCEATDLSLTIHPHPTLSETVALSAEAFEGTLTDLYLPRRR